MKYRILLLIALLAAPAAQAASPAVKMDVAAACKDYARSMAMHPATVKFSLFARFDSDTKTGGVISVNEFTAKNAFGVPDTFTVICHYEDGRFVKNLVVKQDFHTTVKWMLGG